MAGLLFSINSFAIDNNSWVEAGSTRFHTARDQAIIKLDPPQRYDQIQFQMNNALKLKSAKLVTTDDKVSQKINYSTTKAILKTQAKKLREGLGLIKKVVISYENPQKNQGTITLLGRALNEKPVEKARQRL